MKTYLTALAISVSGICAMAQNVGIGIPNPAARLDVHTETTSDLSAVNAKVNYTGLVDIPAITGYSKPAAGWGLGATLQGGYMGLYSEAQAGDYAGNAYGVQGIANGSTGTRIGIYGSASGGSINWAGYFAGRGRFTDDLILDKSVSINDTAFIKNVYSFSSNLPLRIESGNDLLVKIDQPDNGSYTSVFKVTNGAGNDVFAADENGNARTYGTHYIDDQLGIGTFTPLQKLDVDNGNLVVQGINSFQDDGHEGIVYLGDMNHYIKGEYAYGVKIGTYGAGDALFIREGSGAVGIGIANPPSGYKLAVDGKIIGEELKIKNSEAWPDYVFGDDYQLMTLEDLHSSIQANGHLPGIPTAKQVEENGLLVGDMQRRMMEKIEELTLYVLQLHAEIEALKNK